MMPRRTVDVARDKRTMILTGGEDTALLRSNRSAHAGAWTQQGARRSDGSLPSITAKAFSPPSDKPRGLGQSPKLTPRRGGTYVRMRDLNVMDLALIAGSGLQVIASYGITIPRDHFRRSENTPASGVLGRVGHDSCQPERSSCLQHLLKRTTS